jgi:aspartate/methionine/tyrosine aminotransferase
MSKAFGLAGLRLGWIVSKSPEVLQAVECYKDYLSICSSVISEHFSELALRHKDQIVGRNMDIINKNKVILKQFLEDHSETLATALPSAGCLVYPRLKISRSAEELAVDLVQKKSLLILPSNKFNPADTRHFRLGFGRADFEHCLGIFSEYLKQHHQK